MALGNKLDMTGGNLLFHRSSWMKQSALNEDSEESVGQSQVQATPGGVAYGNTNSGSKPDYTNAT